MKHIGSVFEYEQERNEDLMRAYREEIARAGVIRILDIFRAVVEQPSRRFWVSEERAFIVISRMAKGDMLETMRPLKREMYGEIYSRYQALRRKHRDSSMRHLVAMAVCQPAPKFYIEPASARLIVYKLKQQWRKERKPFLHRRR